MSRSKEGMDREKNAATSDQSEEPSKSNYLDERLGAKGQTDYTAGRESWREYPRRSTSLRGRSETGSESRNLYDSPSQGDYADRNRMNRANRYERPFRARGESSSPYSDRAIGEYGRASNYGQYDREGRYGRHTYDDLRYGRADHEDFPRSQGRYRANERSYDYDRDDYRTERGDYDEAYNREALSGRYDYDRDDYRMERGGGYAPQRDNRSDYRGRENNDLRCGDIMTRDVTICSPQTMLREVADKMQDEGVGSIPVVDGGRLVGIVTDRDIVCRVIAEGRDTRTTPASEAMSEDLVTCTADDSVHEAIRKMGEQQIRRIPIADTNGRLRGIIAMADIALEAERNIELANALEQISQPTPNSSRRR